VFLAPTVVSNVQDQALLIVLNVTLVISLLMELVKFLVILQMVISIKMTKLVYLAEQIVKLAVVQMMTTVSPVSMELN
jgi:hypothetical protein